MKEVTWSEDQTMKQESGGFVWHHKGLDAERIKRQLWTEKWMGRNAWSKIFEEMREREQQDFEDDKAALFLNGRKAGTMEKMGL